jgi:hypothetical protein
MTEEGLHENRRAGESVATPAYNLAMYMMEMGRLDEALAYQDEAVASVAERGPAGGTWLRNRAVVHRLRDDTSAAESDESAAAASETIVEPQNAAEMLLAHGWASWSHDPATALGELATGLEEKGLLPEILWLDVAQAVARMALRLGDRSRLERAVEQHRRSRWPGTPALDAQDRWVDGLLADNVGLAIEDAAARLADLGYMRRALDAWTDAALIAARARRPSVAQDRAMTLATSAGIHPLLGPLPETRWLLAAEATTSS